METMVERPPITRTIKKGTLTNKNWKVYHPSGKLMFLCDDKKKEWYTTRDLAEVIDEDSIRLTFEPNGVGFREDDEFGLTPRVVQCVCCGNTDEEAMQRHHIVPYMYRKYMPIDYKSKNHHDVALICYTCHDIYERHATEFKKLINSEHQVTLPKQHKRLITRNIYGTEGNYKHIVSYVTAMLYHADRIPADIKAEMTDCISRFLEKDNFTVEDLEQAWQFIQDYQHEISSTNDPIGKIIMDNTKDLDAFLIRWRKHFLETMEPKFMPTGWDVNRTYRPRIS